MLMMTKRIYNASGGGSVLPQPVVLFQDGKPLPAAFVRVCALTLAFAALWLAFGSAPLMAKRRKPPTSKTVTGQVFDASDNAIAGAAVEMTNLTTGKTTAIYVGPDGRFTFTDIKLTEDYQFRARYKGQSSEVRKVSSWDTRTSLVLNLHIPPPSD
jgi:Carboxypeptidase regulatory-like domain